MAKILESPRSNEKFQKSLDNSCSNKFRRRMNSSKRWNWKGHVSLCQIVKNLIREILDHKLERGYKQLGTQVDCPRTESTVDVDCYHSK